MNSTQKESIAGFTAGLTTTLFTHPLDLIKVRLQLSTQRSHALRGVLLNIKNNVTSSNRSVITEIYKGLTPNLIGNVTGWSLYFTIYEELKLKFGKSNNTIKFFSASTLSGLLTSILTNPIWVLKTRLISENSGYKSTIDAINQIYKNEGIKVFWRGSLPSLFQVFQTSVQFTIYDHLKSFELLTPYKDLYDLQFYFFASSTAKFSAMLIMYPFQVLRSNLQKKNSKAFKDEFLNLYRTNGFYRGFTLNLLKVLPATSVTFLTYESVKSYLNA